MAKKKSKRRSGHQPRSAVPIDGVLADVVDEIASLVGLLRSASELPPNAPDEIAEWAKVLKVKLDDSGPAMSDSVTAITASRLDRMRVVLEMLRAQAVPTVVRKNRQRAYLAKK